MPARRAPRRRLHLHIKDGDGDTSHTTLTISIGDSTPTDSIPGAGLASTTVYEAGLPARGGESAGSNAAANSETTSAPSASLRRTACR
ncbi:hypothetical protein NLY44_32810 [Mesorhizobium sp. C089B]|uniref:hypothetical protein n=1 Tax=Mesorhizobium sp. C089B TaxID=2956823 RepID=UPI0025766FE0|nr:hypothetical protein [Mesorhizobium sp. C089B]WJI51164.1 hypothetical protein NLY44_32810 [Mesorhizobium sp. C089B]